MEVSILTPGLKVASPAPVSAPVDVPIAPVAPTEFDPVPANDNAAPKPAVARSAAPGASWNPQAIAFADKVQTALNAAGLHGLSAVPAALEAMQKIAEGLDLKSSVTIGKLATGQVLASHDADTVFNPASNTKLTSASFALHTLGPDFRYETPLRIDPASGNVYLQGRFDPTLDEAALTQLFRATGGKIRGDIILDDSALTKAEAPDGYASFGNEEYDYLAPPSPLAFNRDHNVITVSCGDDGVPKVLEDDPGLPLRNEIQAIPEGQHFKVTMNVEHDAKGQAVLVLGGTLAKGAKPRTLIIKTPDPVKDVADAVSRVLAKEGIELGGAIRPLKDGETVPADTKTLATHSSATLAQILGDSLAKSLAFDMEMHALAASRSLRGDGPVSIEDGVADLNTFLSKDAGLSGFTSKNASGLGNVDRFSSGQIFKLLTFAQSHADVAPMLADLAVAGRTGTLALRMQGTEAEGRLHAKTGTDGDAIAFSGWVGPLAFSALTRGSPDNRPAARAWVDALGIVLARLTDPVGN